VDGARRRASIPMTRVLSGAVLVAVVVSAIWFLGPMPLLVLTEAVLVLAVHEYGRLARGLQLRIPTVAAGAAAMLTCAAVAVPGAPLDAVLVAALVALGTLSLAEPPGPAALGEVSAALFASIYLGLSLGALVAIRSLAGRDALLLLLATVVVSDTSQYYSGRLFGRRRLAPAISPGKTVEGAIGGFVGGVACMVALGRWGLPGVPAAPRALLGVALVALGIAGDLFESRLKRGAGLKDSSALIPGHGGVLDRIDALLFAAPAYYLFVRYGLGFWRGAGPG